MKNTHADQLEALSEIRDLMEKSSRFLSLSGLSGVAAGIFALIGAGIVYLYLEVSPFSNEVPYYLKVEGATKWGMDYRSFFVLDAIAMLVLAIGTGILFTTRKARKNGHKIWNQTAQRALTSLAIPLVAGGLFCLALLHHNYFGIIAPATLLFYGVGLVNASKYTLPDIYYLGLLEIGLGILSAFFMGYGLEFWMIGFGVLHIVYGILMYNKYDRKTA